MHAVELDGLALSRAYYEQVVRPLLARRRPELRHAAGRLGEGSEVLGLDDDVSRDHDWGLRLTLLVDAEDVAQVDGLLAAELSDSFLGLPTRFALSHDPAVRHRVQVETPAAFLGARLGVVSSASLSALDWLAMTGQALLEVTSEAVFADTAGELTRIRAAFAWYPDDLWLHVVAADWARLAEELPFVGRAGQRGDDAGSRVIAGRLCRTLMHLGFMVERRWPPYSKWLGSAFAALPAAGSAAADLQRAMAADTWRRRQQHLAAAAAQLYRTQHAAGLPCVDAAPTEPFHDRPFLGVPPVVVDVLRAAVTDPVVSALPPGLGAIEQWVDDVVVLTSPALCSAAVRACLGTRDR